MKGPSPGFLAIERGDWQEAINLFRRDIERKRGPAAFFGFGVAHFLLGDHETARWAFHKTLEFAPGDPEAVEYLARIEKVKGEAGERKTDAHRREWRFRSRKGYLEVNRGEWQKLFIKGINLGLGLPGYFPGEYCVKKGTYRKWFGQMSDLGFNAVRIYTIHPPHFYEALEEWNRSGRTLYLFQGIWAELPERADFSGGAYLAYVRENIRNAVDIVHGKADLPERPGYPHGKYTVDVSWFTAGFLYGREWEPCSVKQFNESGGRRRGDYRGGFLEIADGTPFEVRITETVDFLQSYEHRRYSETRPCSVVNWPTLDPLDHPSESTSEWELSFQGQKVKAGVCNDNEDMETLDVAKIRSVKGAGFFATYHAYPYYPDFMNHDYSAEKVPYLAYLNALKAHHGDQPVLVAEFGVPSSREYAHRHRDGWNHGGHDEEAQVRINGLQMKAVHDSGMAGGILFSWFDEWFKKNWVFQPFALPPDRKPLWFNLQDPEQNYGLLAAYPGYPRKKVTLSGSLSEWEDAATLYEKHGGPAGHGFRDGGDDARTLRRLRVQHDEGFLYILLETTGEVDFLRARYLVGINTSLPETGEFLLPCGTDLRSPIGLHFLVHLAGREGSRILVCRPYDRYLNAGNGEIVPGQSDQGAWVVLQNRPNARRISRDGRRFFPSHVYSMSTLRHGSLDEHHPGFHSLADFLVSGNRVEIRLPWCQLNFTDPSSRTVLWKGRGGNTRTTEGIRLIAVSYRPRKDSPVAEKTGKRSNVTDSLPERLDPGSVRLYSWDRWDTPSYHTYLKRSCLAYKELLSAMPEEV